MKNSIQLNKKGISDQLLSVQNNGHTSDHFLLEIYLQFGKRLPEMLEGDFSFVIYDKEADTYFCARDPLGIKALYYTKTENGYMFSEDIDELLALFSVEKKPNLKSMRSMLLCQAVDYHDTMYENIYRLPPGSTLTIENGKEKIERYWHPEKIEIDYGISEDEAAKKLRDIFEKAVEERISDLEGMAFEVSGGLDSSSVVSILSQKNDASMIDSYSMDFGTLECDESEYVDALLEQYSLNHKKIPVDQLDYSGKYSLEFLYLLSPNWPITLTFAMYLPLLEQIRKDGKKVVLTGQGGDHLFGGTPLMMYTLFIRGRFISLYRELQRYNRPFNVFKSYVVKHLIGEKIVDLIKKTTGKKSRDEIARYDCGIVDISNKSNVKNPALLHDIDAVSTAFHATVMDGNLFHCAEKHFGIEYRHPFFDKELVEFALSLPPEMKYKNGKIKWILRKAMEGILPDKINQRTDKAEFSELIRQQIDALNLTELLDEPYIVKLGLIEQKVIDKQVDAYLDKSLKNQSFLWAIINVEYWYRYNQFQSLR